MVRRREHPWLFVLAVWATAGAFLAHDVVLGLVLLAVSVWLLLR